MFPSRATSTPQLYEVRCPCGGRVTGVRTDTIQLRPCPGCRQQLLVLPASVYPLPKSKSSTSAGQSGPDREQQARAGTRRKVASRPAADDADTIESETETAEAAPNPGSPRKTAASLAVPAAATRRLSLRNSIQQQTDAVQQQIAAALHSFRRAWLTPLKLALVAIAFLAAGTGYWLHQLHLRNLAEQRVVEQVRRAEQKVAEGDLFTAAESYLAATAALNELGRDDSQARRIRQTTQEYQAVTSICSRSPQELLEEAVKSSRDTVGLSWPELFRATYADHWLVFDAEVSRTGDGEFLIDYPLVANGQSAEIRGKFPQLSLIPEDRLPGRLLLAGRLAELKEQPGNPGRWELMLAADSVFLWSSPETLQKLGLFGDSGEESRPDALLDEQTGWLKLAPPTTSETAAGSAGPRDPAVSPSGTGAGGTGSDSTTPVTTAPTSPAATASSPAPAGAAP